MVPIQAGIFKNGSFSILSPNSNLRESSRQWRPNIMVPYFVENPGKSWNFEIIFRAWKSQRFLHKIEKVIEKSWNMLGAHVFKLWKHFNFCYRSLWYIDVAGRFSVRVESIAHVLRISSQSSKWRRTVEQYWGSVRLYRT